MTPALDLGPDGSTLTISPTQLNVTKRCFTEYRYNYLYRRTAEEPSAALVAGGAFDAALNLRYSQMGNKPPTDEVITAQHCIIDAAFADVELPDTEYRNPTLFKQALDQYNAAWSGVEPWEVLAVQEPFEVALGSVGKINVRLRGILDMLVRTPDSHTLVLDTKTSNSYTDMSVVQHQNSNQAKAYCWAMTELGTYGPIHGFLLNAVVIRKPYAEGRKSKANDLPRFEVHRPRIYFTRERLDEWRRDTLDWVSMLLTCVEQDRFPMNESHCANHFGKACPYLRVCESQPSQREDVLASDLYKDYSRSPIDELTPA